MVELLRYLEANGFATYIASGGDRDFMRPFAEVSTASRRNGLSAARSGSISPTRRMSPDSCTSRRSSSSTTDPRKSVRIWSRLGRRPLLAVGHSNGDMEMLRFARTRERDGLRLLVRHDDSAREFGYDQGAEDALRRAAEHGWTVVSMRNDWTRVCPDP